MQIIIPPHKLPSKKVSHMSEITEDMNKMMVMVKDLVTDYGVLHHSQVSKKPYNFFVITPTLRPLFKHNWVICNPKIISYTNRAEVKEVCSSYIGRTPKNVSRYSRIKIRCLVENPALLGGLIEEELELSSMPAFLVQHQIDHAQGKRLYSK